MSAMGDYDTTSITSLNLGNVYAFGVTTINTDAVFTDTAVLNTPKQVKGGVFAAADIDLIKRALDVYKTTLVENEESERNPSQELIQLANLLHRLNNRI